MKYHEHKNNSKTDALKVTDTLYESIFLTHRFQFDTLFLILSISSSMKCLASKYCNKSILASTTNRILFYGEDCQPTRSQSLACQSFGSADVDTHVLCDISSSAQGKCYSYLSYTKQKEIYLGPKGTKRINYQLQKLQLSLSETLLT